MITVDHSCATPCTHNTAGREGLRRGRGHRQPARGGERRDRRVATGRYTNVTHIDMPVTPSRVWAAMNG